MAHILFSTSETGIKRDIVIKCYENGDVIYKYDDPLLFYGAETVDRVKKYFKAIQMEDVQYLYDYIRAAYEDGDSSSYSDLDHNEEYVALATKTIQNYKDSFQLKTMEYVMSGLISSACSPSLQIEFTISGLSSKDEVVAHKINGIYEFPAWGVNDLWFGNNSSNLE